jgi:hypothetical protein
MRMRMRVAKTANPWFPFWMPLPHEVRMQNQRQGARQLPYPGALWRWPRQSVRKRC